MRLIVRDLKTFSSADEARSSVDVFAILEKSVRVAHGEIARRARLIRDLQPVPRVHASESRLGQVFLNLLINAAQAIPEGAPSDHAIHVSARSPDGHVTVAVRDTGCGIPQDQLRLIFDPFFTTKPAGTGTGLGLAIAVEIVRGIGGRIEVESEVGRGSTFTVRLPASNPAVAGEGAGSTTAATPRG